MLLVYNNSISKKSTRQTRRDFFYSCCIVSFCFFFFLFHFVWALVVCHSIVAVITLVGCLLSLFVRLSCSWPRSPFLARALKFTKFSRFIFLLSWQNKGLLYFWQLPTNDSLWTRCQEEVKDDSSKNDRVGGWFLGGCQRNEWHPAVAAKSHLFLDQSSDLVHNFCRGCRKSHSRTAAPLRTLLALTIFFHQQSEQRVTLWWELSRPNVSQVQFPDSFSYANWLCWSSTILREVFFPGIDSIWMGLVDL